MKQRRGLSTVIGGVFFLIAIITAASYFTSSMNLFEDFSENVIAAEQERENRTKESFDISRLTIENNKINLDVFNSGEIPISFSRLWVENVTGVDQVYRFDLNQTVAPGNRAENILEFLPFVALDTESYKMKLVTDRGITQEFSVNASTDPLHLQLFALPEELPNNFKSTILLSVTNNSTENTIYTNIQPILNIVSLGATAQLEGSLPEAHPVLEKGNTAMFEWTYRISGEGGDKVQFDANILNGVPGNVVSKEVTIKTVEFAEQSGSSLESNFLTSGSPVSDNQLFFHKETFDALGERQMWAAGPENNTGEIIDFSSTDAIFYTNTDGNVTVNIPDGKWNATLRYISSSMPPTLTHTGSAAEDMAYHFESDLNKPLDTTTNTEMKLGKNSKRPTWIATGHQGAGALEFSGNQFATIKVNNDNDLDDSPTTTAGWFNADSSGPNDKQTILYGENSSGSDDYEIFLNSSGHLVFRLDASFTSRIATCTSTVDYRDDIWHHFVAVMPSDNDCKLYADGVFQDSDFNGGSGRITLSDKIYVGARNDDPDDGFHGMLDDIIHWDNYDLDESGQQEVLDLFNTNYGTTSHFMDFDISIVDEFGNDLGASDKIISQSLSYPIPYASDFAEFSSPLSDIWGQVNFTAITNDQRIIEPSERLMIKMTYVPKSIGNLDMKMVIDDTDVVSGLGNSFLQTPFPDTGLPGYGGYDNANTGIISIFNPGPEDHWIKYQSRVVFEEEITSAPYAAFILNVNGTTLGPTQDSPAILAGTTVQVEFERPRIQPGNPSSELIPEGRYKMYVFLDGYNSEGQVFLQTSFVGLVRVV